MRYVHVHGAPPINTEFSNANTANLLRAYPYKPLVLQFDLSLFALHSTLVDLDIMPLLLQEGENLSHV